MKVKRNVDVCDMRHGDDVESVGTLELILDGKRFKVDLCDEHRTEARRAVRPWLSAATSAGKEKPVNRRSPGSSTSARARSAAMRAWAAENDIELPARGRIPKSVHEAYKAATR